MTFTSKKDADAYDKMLDIAESLEAILSTINVPLSEQQVESLALEMAKDKENIINALKGALKTNDVKPQKNEEKKIPSDESGNVAKIKKVS